MVRRCVRDLTVFKEVEKHRTRAADIILLDICFYLRAASAVQVTSLD